MQKDNISLTRIVKNLHLIFLAGLCYFAVQALFHPGFFPIHDNEQIARLFELHKTLNAHEIPPRIAQDLGFGYGYPFFNFYPSFVYYLAEVFKLIGFSYITAIKCMILVGFLGSAFGMYLFSKEFLGKTGGFLSAVAYTYVPYHSVDLYVRGALPEFFSFVFIPLVFLLYYRLCQKPSVKTAVLLGVVQAGFIVTHNLIFLMSFLFIPLFVLVLLSQTKRKKAFLFFCFLSLLVAFLLSAYFWIPAYVEKQYTLVDAVLTSELARYSLHYVCIREFFLVSWGYGGSIGGCNDGLSFQIGVVHIVGVFLAIIAIILSLHKKKKDVIPLVFLFFFFMSLFLQTKYASFLWDAIPQLWYIQFPWRFLTFTAFASSFLASFAIVTLPQKNALQKIAGIVFIIAILFFYKDYFVPSQYYLFAKDADYTNRHALEWDTSKISFEYVPKNIATVKSSIGTTQVKVSEDQISKTSYTVISGDLVVSELKNLPQEKAFHVSSTNGGILRVNTYSFPGWTMFLDGKTIEYGDTNPLRLITISVPSGDHLISAQFLDTPVRFLSNIVSLISVVILLLYGIYLTTRVKI